MNINTYMPIIHRSALDDCDTPAYTDTRGWFVLCGLTRYKPAKAIGSNAMGNDVDGIVCCERGEGGVVSRNANVLSKFQK